jgi:hypothetical protein
MSDMRQGGVRTCFEIERCPRLSNALASGADALQILEALLITFVDVTVSNGFRSRGKLQQAVR